MEREHLSLVFTATWQTRVGTRDPTLSPSGRIHSIPCLQGQFYCAAQAGEGPILSSAAAGEGLGQLPDSPEPVRGEGGEWGEGIFPLPPLCFTGLLWLLRPFLPLFGGVPREPPNV